MPFEYTQHEVFKFMKIFLGQNTMEAEFKNTNTFLKNSQN